MRKKDVAGRGGGNLLCVCGGGGVGMQASSHTWLTMPKRGGDQRLIDQLTASVRRYGALRTEGGRRLTRDLFTGNSDARAVRCGSAAADVGVGRGLKGVGGGGGGGENERGEQ